jgi:hypothetical protein
MGVCVELGWAVVGGNLAGGGELASEKGGQEEGLVWVLLGWLARWWWCYLSALLS